MFPGLYRYMFRFIPGATVGLKYCDVPPGERDCQPRLTNPSLNLSGFSENLPNLSLQIPKSPTEKGTCTPVIALFPSATSRRG